MWSLWIALIMLVLLAGVEVSLVELKDIQPPESMKRAMARQAEGEALAADALGTAADIKMAHPLTLQLLTPISR